MKVASIVEYEGTKYHGFQYQVEVSTVQGELEKSIQKLTGEKVRVSGAGRTDAGVHAAGQVISFELTPSTDFKSVASGINHYLPDDIALKSVYEVGELFDPRRDAVSRVYKYKIWNSPVRTPLMRRITTQISGKLDFAAMCEGADIYLGTHDFRKFSGPLNIDGATTVRRIIRSEICQEGPVIDYTVEGNAFLPHQVRRMMGALVDVGRKIISMDDLDRMLGRNSDKIAHSLPPQGLSLEEVRYDGFPPSKGKYSC